MPRSWLHGLLLKTLQIFFFLLKWDKNPPDSRGAASSDRAATVQLSSLIPAQPTPLMLILKLTFQKVLIDENWLHLPLLHAEHTNVMAQTWSMPSLMTHFRLHQFIVLKLFSFNQQSFRRNKYFVESQIFQKLVMIIKLELELEVEFDEICISYLLLPPLLLSAFMITTPKQSINDWPKYSYHWISMLNIWKVQGKIPESRGSFCLCVWTDQRQEAAVSPQEYWSRLEMGWYCLQQSLTQCWSPGHWQLYVKTAPSAPTLRILSQNINSWRYSKCEYWWYKSVQLI